MAPVNAWEARLSSPPLSPPLTSVPAAASSSASSPVAASASSKDAVRVVVRCRPPFASVGDQGRNESKLDFKSPNVVRRDIAVAYRFDAVHCPAVARPGRGAVEGQGRFYKAEVEGLVGNFVDGYNAAVLAYGQTGSGKTYTMGTGAGAEDGIVPRVVEDVFGRLDVGGGEKGNAEAVVKVGFLEVHNEVVRDLLQEPGAAQRRGLVVREIEGDVVVQGAREVVCSSADEALEVLREGVGARSTAGTSMNKESSRSHAIFTVALERIKVEKVGGVVKRSIVRSKFHLVDLAGSERAKRTGAKGERLKESMNINQGLLCLGKVIRALSAPESGGRARSAHVPYRESKLTRILQDSLGGNSRTLMVACVSPESTDFHETLNTVVYASQARNIRNRPVVVNRIVESVDLTSHKMIEAKLRDEIGALNTKLKDEVAGLSHELNNQIVNLRFASAEAKYRLLGIIGRDEKSLRPGLKAQLEQIVALLIDEDTPLDKVEEPTKALRRLGDKVEGLERDLERDEEIFSAKSKELRALQRHLHKTIGKVKDLEAENLRLKKTPSSGTGKGGTSLQKVKLEEQLQAATDDYHIQKRAYSLKIQQIEINVSVKREQVSVIEKGKNDALRLMEEHERRKEELGKKVERICEEINKKQLRKRLPGADEDDDMSVLSDSLGGDCEDEDVDELERSLERAESELNSLSNQIRDQQRIVSLQKRGERRIEELVGEVEKMEAERIKYAELSRQFELGFAGIKRDLGRQIEECQNLPQPQSGSPGGVLSTEQANGGGGKMMVMELELERLRNEMRVERRKNQELAEVNLQLVSELKEVKKAKTVRMVKMKARKLVEVPPPPLC